MRDVIPLRAAMYLRSSKDRSDVSPAAQRHALEALASSRSLSVVAKFEDAVESGSTEDRPGFIEMLRQVKDPRRGWNALLVYDTSRIARRRYIAQAFKHELKKRGIALHYATIPELDPITDVIVTSTFEAMDEVHSMMSREKGLAGMAENVRQGFRAGGRAPLGYKLKQIHTGAIREGKPVTKSQLELSEISHQVAQYLRARARGEPRIASGRAAQLDVHDTTLIGIEWNALTYAGHTVWNVHREAGSGSKRRPREEWHITRDTHPALITEAEAESLIARLETSDAAAARRRSLAESSPFLLSGLLLTTDGRRWEGCGRNYRLRKCNDLAGRLVRTADVDSAIVETLTEFRTSDRYLTWLLELAKKAQSPANSPGADIRAQIRKLERERARAAEAAVADGGDVFAPLVSQRTRQIQALNLELAALEREVTRGTELKSLTVESLRTLVAETDPGKVVRMLVAQVVLEPDLHCQIRLRDTAYSARWASVASPGGFGHHPTGYVLPVAGLLRRSA